MELLDHSSLLGIFGYNIVEQSYIPEGRVYVMGRTLFVAPAPSEVAMLFRDVRRSLARTCPLIAPLEWRELADLRGIHGWLKSLRHQIGAVNQ